MPAKSTGVTSHRSKDIIISSIISIAITIVFGYYFLYIGNRERKPTFYLDPTRTTILDKINAANAPLFLLKSNGDTIHADVTSVYFYFFNQGSETIKKENVYEPLKIVLKDKAEILDFKLLKVARPVSGIKLVRDTASNSLSINSKRWRKMMGWLVKLSLKETRMLPSRWKEELKALNILKLICQVSIHYTLLWRL